MHVFGASVCDLWCVTGSRQVWPWRNDWSGGSNSCGRLIRLLVPVQYTLGCVFTFVVFFMRFVPSPCILFYIVP